ncbi:hypothetical protein [Infirmifilum sp. NZ]|uniref:hypothetical protein n=1 Tax=Infirmifilum sp. NZ TaxID=2926850 RepID=UPI0027A18E4B|nr:hypothetical protein [Infirmifilum sp. NZ]UNQ73778.1 hypothetical protein MOV14_01895 [Infirmifilum sp. NZ]
MPESRSALSGRVDTRAAGADGPKVAGVSQARLRIQALLEVSSGMGQGLPRSTQHLSWRRVKAMPCNRHGSSSVAWGRLGDGKSSKVSISRGVRGAAVRSRGYLEETRLVEAHRSLAEGIRPQARREPDF